MTVLIVDDSEFARTTMRQILENSSLDVRIIEAEDGEAALPVVLDNQESIDVVVSDVVMPRLDGLGLLRQIREVRDRDALPVILVTSSASDEGREASFATGASDYLSRPFSAIELVSRVQVQLRLKSLQSELRRATERFRRLGSHDELTGLANQRHLRDLSRRELARSRRHTFALSIAVIDVDKFKEVNQRVGPLVGDAVLSELGSLLQQELRTPDVLARIGGEKFGALLPQTDTPQARLVCDRLCAAVHRYAFPSHRSGDITLAIGFATYPSGSLESVDELFNAAEMSLDKAKARGGNRVELAEPSHD